LETKQKKKAKKQKEKEPVKEQVPKDLFRLSKLDFSVNRGSKVAIVGAVGSGKSSLLSGLIGEMPKLTGSLEVHGTVAYCAQQPWILTDTIEGNIVFNQEFDQEKLDSVLKACGLDADLLMFPAGLKTEIGEKGVNLSGGQKARVALARAMYRNSDILLLDDPISALDAQVGRLVFDLGIKEYLSPKTVVLVTHQLHLLPEMDHIIVLDKGVMVEQGSFKELMGEASLLSELMKAYSIDEDNSGKTTKKEITVQKDDANAKGGIIVAEDQEQGSVNLNIFWHYFDKCGGWLYVITFVTASLLNSATQIVNNLWLTWWSTDKYKLDLGTNMQIYGYLGLGQFAFALVINAVFLAGGYRASKYYHNAALKRLMRAPMDFFDSQPIGRILNRMSKDIESGMFHI
jgi:ATP-binding cassette subfamily C (CFTR/MRP) protein 1